MLDFQALKEKRLRVMELVAGLGPDDLRRLTNEMIDDMLAAIAGCTDADVVFVPVDPEANDPYADNAADAELAWTLGHVIVHATASAEESAALATVLARGAAIHGRSRYETPWQTVTAIAQCRQRLEESRRMRLASLAMWPDHPHLDNCYAPSPTTGEIHCIARFVLGLRHDWDHIGQMREIVRQARAARLEAVPA
jgi:hypothetical protein